MDPRKLIYNALFNDSSIERSQAHQEIRSMASTQGINPATLFPLYDAIGSNEVSNSFTVPAINIRTLTFDTASIIFNLMKKHNIGPVIFEIARSEMDYTKQDPEEYSSSILAAALHTKYKGPVFIQGDHFQINKRIFDEKRSEEIHSLENLILSAIQAQFYNIDIDASTLVDLAKNSPLEQQSQNSELTGHFTSFIRNNQPGDINIAIGGEIGHIGGINSTLEDFKTFMDGYKTYVEKKGISKVSLQTGSSHGGSPLPDGSVKNISIDFSVLNTIGKVARETYHLAGAVQHGASTLPLELFNKFPQNNTAEIHLATGFQNIVFDTMPTKLRDEMYNYVRQNFASEQKEQTTEQFIYKLRKKSLGLYKKQMWNLSFDEKQPILSALEKQYEIIFEKLGIFQTKNTIQKYYKYE